MAEGFLSSLVLNLAFHACLFSCKEMARQILRRLLRRYTSPCHISFSVIDYVIWSVCPSVCLSVRPSHVAFLPLGHSGSWCEPLNVDMLESPVSFTVSICNDIWSLCEILDLICIIWGCTFYNWPTLVLMNERIYVLHLIVIIKSEVSAFPIDHCLGIGHETMVCAACFYIFLWNCDMIGLLRETNVLVAFAPNLVLCHWHVALLSFARNPTDEWHLAAIFSLRYFSVVVCLRRLYHHILLAHCGGCRVSWLF